MYNSKAFKMQCVGTAPDHVHMIVEAKVITTLITS